ncbi:DUF2637 domain-containing protein [Amycolatopsis sp. WAC 01416]|uniref:DUF2637 domain-containing protein n=1 Tax=Amycolatopsis sp. WAC 01416 TaxID=2203196 RepID=UPI000F786CA6|nr:DUF2637 domain-containing protein [Amycolatopsis sp. WAC 01416]RSN27498.1 DUF2637 domain-containing protein [Amycolatopsis sp. WAC 01416]
MSTTDTTQSAGLDLVGIVRIIVTVALGAIGGAAGFMHTHDWAAHHGQTGWLAWADAVVIEGIVVVAGFEVQRDHRRGNTKFLTFPMVVLFVGFGVQMTAQVALAEPTPAGWLVAALPALGFLVVVKLLMRHAPETETAPPSTPAEIDPAPVPAERPAPPAPSPRLRLPAEISSRVDAAVTAARSEGREVTTEDIRRVARIPEQMAAQVLAQLTTHNGHKLDA